MKVEMLRLALARNLARAIIKEGTLEESWEQQIKIVLKLYFVNLVYIPGLLLFW